MNECDLVPRPPRTGENRAPHKWDKDVTTTLREQFPLWPRIASRTTMSRLRRRVYAGCDVSVVVTGRGDHTNHSTSRSPKPTPSALDPRPAVRAGEGRKASPSFCDRPHHPHSAHHETAERTWEPQDKEIVRRFSAPTLPPTICHS